jgi:hypothetical protein
MLEVALLAVTITFSRRDLFHGVRERDSVIELWMKLLNIELHAYYELYHRYF